MTHVDLDRVEPAFDEDARAVCELLRDGRQVGLGDCMRAAHPERTEHARRRQTRMLRPRGVRDRARVSELRGRGRALGVDRVREPAQPGADLGVVERELVTIGAAGPRDRAVRHRRHTDTAGCDLPVERDQFVGDDATRRATLERRGLDDAIPQGDRSEPSLGEGA